MSERSIADAVADLRIGGLVMTPRLCNEAADLIERLDADLSLSVAAHWEALKELRELDALRPPCQTCGGTHQVFSRMLDLGLGDGPEKVMKPCPDCPDDGKASWEQMTATYRAVWDEPKGTTAAFRQGHNQLLDRLRSVKP